LFSSVCPVYDFSSCSTSTRYSRQPAPTLLLTSQQAFTGLGTAYATALFAGPVASIGFVIGSCVGYIASAIFYWRTAMETALIAFDDHPELLHLHLVKNYPNIGFQKLRLGDREGREAFKVG